MEFKNLVNTYGVSNNEDEKDTLNMYIYSDYLDQKIKVPRFTVKNREIVLFTDLVVPCINELIVNIVKDETPDQKPTYNTIRIECNSQTVGYSQREFRFHDVLLSQIDYIAALDIPVVEYFTKSAISIFRRIIYGEDDDSSKSEAYKDFNNAAMFQVAEVVVDTYMNSTGPANASYSLSVKNTESFRLARRYANMNAT
jgi:hypothetical protein